MGHRKDPEWIAECLKGRPGLRVLEVGAGHEDSKAIRRSVEEAGCEYVGIDMEGAEITHDLTEPLNFDPFDAVVCLSVLEHCKKPWRMAENIEDLLKPGGALMLSAPFAWRLHDYPGDYWRFTPDGIRLLFPRIAFKEWLWIPGGALDMPIRGKVMIWTRGTRK